MKLVYLTGVGLPTSWAHGIQITKMCEAFAENGVEVELIFPRRVSVTKKSIFEFYDVKKIFKITHLPCLDIAPGRSGVLFFWTRTLSFLLVAKVYLFFKKYDVLYTREVFAGLFFKNFILEIHALPDKIGDWHKKIWKRAEKIIAITSFAKNDLICAGIGKEKILIAPDGVNVKKTKFQASNPKLKEKLNLPRDKKIIMYAGSFYLYDWKGVDVLLEAAKFTGNNCAFVLIGGEDAGIAHARKEYSPEKVVLIGRRPHAEIPLYLASADVLVLPNKKGDNISEKYTSPLKLFEYMASGRPIVASDLPSTREILNEENAVLVEPNNPRALAEGIKKILNDSALAEKISTRARENAQKYDWHKRAEKILKFISQKNV